jgi:hypothetical protein
MSEYALSVAVARVIDAAGLLYTHVPNERHDPKTGAQLQRMGTKAGVPDYLIFGFRDGRTPSTPLAIELKVGAGRTSPEQDEWIAALRRCGWRVEVCSSVEEVLAALEGTYREGLYQPAPDASRLRHDLANEQAKAQLAIELADRLKAERDELRLRVEALEGQAAGPDCGRCELAEAAQ